MKKQYFGTDGIRGTVGQSPLTPDFMLRLGYAAGRVLSKEPGGRVVIGKDTRRSGAMIQAALEAGLTAAGVDVYRLHFMPTPGVAYLTRTFHAVAGIVISASHNPHYDNGIKFFTSKGEKISDELEYAIEAELDKPIEVVHSTRVGDVYTISDAQGRYVEFCKASVPPFLTFNDLHVVVDCAHGATTGIAANVLTELGAKVDTLGDQPNGLNINDKVGSTHPSTLQATVLEKGADLGIAFDGDGDRVIMVDHLGVVVDGDELLYILAKASLEAGRLGTGGVIGTQMSNLGLEKALGALGIPFLRAKVGDRHVMKMLREKSWYIGGESSGHIIWLNSTTTGDGIVSALQILSVMQQKGLPLRTLLADMKKYPQKMINIRLEKPYTEEQQLLIDPLAQQVEDEIKDWGRVLIRPSGTEPLLRVMIEGESLVKVEEKAAELVEKIESLLAT